MKKPEKLNNLLYFLSMLLLCVFLSTCTFFNECLIDPFHAKATTVFIDESNNGVIQYYNKICKIKNLNITNERIYLKDIDNNYSVHKIAYCIDVDGDGFLVYSRNLTEGIYLANDSASPLFVDHYYVMKINKNNFLSSSTKELFEDFIAFSNKINIKSFGKDNFVLNYQSELHHSSSYDFAHYISIVNSNNGKITKYNLSSNDYSENEEAQVEIDKDGNGYLFYKERNSFKYFYLKKYVVGDEISDFEISKNHSDYSNVIKNYLDSNGTGFVIFKKANKEDQRSKWVEDLDNNPSPLPSSYINNQENDIFIRKFINFKPVTEEILFLETDELGNMEERKSIKDLISINKDGNGIIFFNKKNPKDKNTKSTLYNYIKKVVNFKVENKEIKLLDLEKYDYYNFSINSSGNGLVVLTNYNNFIVKKIVKYGVE